MPCLPPPARAQDAALEGVWELKDPATDQRRVDGSLFDGAIRSALLGAGAAAEGAASGPEAEVPRLTIADRLKIIKEMLRNLSSITSWVLVVPHVDPKSGLFAAYRLYRNATFRHAGSQAGAPGGRTARSRTGGPAALVAQLALRRCRRASQHLAISRRSSRPSSRPSRPLLHRPLISSALPRMPSSPARCG